MAGSVPSAVPGGPLDALQTLQSNSHPRRQRPPALDLYTSDENRVPLRPDRMNKRESRHGLRNLFSRSRPRDVEPEPILNARSPAGNRSSLVEISNWPHGVPSSKSLAHLPTIAEPSPVASINKTLPPLPTAGAKRPLTGGGASTKGKPPSTSPKATRRGLATWDPPPLFQAYPQAIRHAQLQASTMSADSILRHNNKKGDTGVRDDLSQSGSTLALDGDLAEGPGQERARKRHRRNTSSSTLKFEWTSKIFILVTSGYLLQYAGEGSFDRLPEKVLQLGKDSAAFASDLIPGRHWVVHVCAAMDPDGTPATDSRTLFSRLPFRGSEKRNASNFLMVFENVEDMEGWLAVLRHEIEALGGKKNLSETGKPKTADESNVSLRPQPSQRTLVVRDPSRFSRIGTQDLLWNNPDGQDGAVRLQPEAPAEHSFDDLSTTTSIVSHDGCQLEGLRESGNRLSYLSSGQRTVITSTGSSPAGSPVREDFSPEQQTPEAKNGHHHDVQPILIEPRPRPNAAAINDRRQSMQVNPLVDYRGTVSLSRPQSIYPDLSTSPHMTPNFSVPQGVGRRYSLVRTPSFEAGQLPPPAPHAREPLTKAARKPPPTSLSLSRPLSTVPDQPSPSPHAAQPNSSNEVRLAVTTEVPDSPTMFSSWPYQPLSEPLTKSMPKYPPRRSSFVPIQETMPLSVMSNPRRFSSMQALRTSDIAGEKPEAHVYYAAKPVSNSSEHPPISLPDSTRNELHNASSRDVHASRSRSPAPPSTRNKRASLQSVKSTHTQNSDGPSVHSMQKSPEVRVTEYDIPESAVKSHHISTTGQPQQSLAHESSRSKSLINRRSMSQLTEGPPPAPPPNCALPPIPRKAS